MTMDDDGLAARLARVGLVVLDVDGTLLARGADRGERTGSEALDALARAGVPWTFATGRTRTALALGVAGLMEGRAMPAAYACNNGAVVVTDGTPSIRAMARGDVAACLAWAAATSRPVNLSVVGRAGPDEDGGGRGDLVLHVEGLAPLDDLTGRPSPLTTPETALAQDVVGVLVGNGRDPSPAELGDLARRLGDGVAVTTSNHGEFIVTAKGADKGTAMAALAHAYAIEPAAVLAVGDGLNDCAMIAAAGIGAAVANADPGLKALADIVASGEGPVGVLELASKLADARRSARTGRLADDDRPGPADVLERAGGR